MSAEDIVLRQVVNQGGSTVPLEADSSDFVFDCGVWCVARAVVGTVAGVVVLVLCRANGMKKARCLLATLVFLVLMALQWLKMGFRAHGVWRGSIMIAI